MTDSAPIEVKHTRGKDRFNCRELKDHQLDALMACETSGGFTFKIPDSGYGFLPFDLLMYKKATTYVCICFPKNFYLVRTPRLQDHRTGTLTEEAVFDLASRKVSLSELR